MGGTTREVHGPDLKHPLGVELLLGRLSFGKGLEQAAPEEGLLLSALKVGFEKGSSRRDP